MIWNDRIRELRSNSNYTLAEIAEILNVSEATAQRYESENGIKNIPYEIIIAYSKVFNVSPSYIMGWDEKNISNQDNFTPHEKELIHKYRALDDRGRRNVETLLNTEYENSISASASAGASFRLIAYYNKIAAAGHAIDSFSDLMQGTIKVLDTPESGKANFAIGVLGDSMEPTFYDGDILLIRKQTELKAGEIGIFQKDNGIYVKELGTHGLVSHNPKYPPMIDDTDVICIGKVLGKAVLA